MSELRDLTAAMRALANSQTLTQECLLVLLRNSEQQSDWRHEHRGIEQRKQLEQEEQQRALKQVQEACGSISHKLAEVVERLDNQSATRLSDVRGLSSRVAELERKAGADEVTQS
jgi:hypothetical protein